MSWSTVISGLTMKFKRRLSTSSGTITKKSKDLRRPSSWSTGTSASSLQTPFWRRASNATISLLISSVSQLRGLMTLSRRTAWSEHAPRLSCMQLPSAIVWMMYLMASSRASTLMTRTLILLGTPNCSYQFSTVERLPRALLSFLSFIWL